MLHTVHVKNLLCVYVNLQKLNAKYIYIFTFAHRNCFVYGILQVLMFEIGYVSIVMVTVVVLR